MTEEEKAKEIPAATILDVLSRYFTRRDLIWEYLAKTDAEILAWLKAIAQAWGVSPVVVPPVVVPPAVPTPAPAVPAAPFSVIAQPEGRIVEQNSITTESDWKTVCSYTPKSGMRFHLTKVVVSCEEDVIAQVFWKGEQEITIPYVIMGKLPFTDWFPFNYWEEDPVKKIVGDGTSKVELKAKYVSTGATCYGQLVGEEV
jgi:hypothetical protein